MDYIAITPQSNALYYNYLKRFRTLFIWNVMKLHGIQTIQPNCVCLLTNERYKTFQAGFSFCHLGHSLGIGLRGAWGQKINSVSHPYAISSKTNAKFGMWVTRINGVCNSKTNLAPPPRALRRGQKFKYHLISITTSISKNLISSFFVFLQIR